MSNPIPLTDPDGRVYAYACGHCHQVAGGIHMFRENPTGPDAGIVDHSRNTADRCCICRRCGAIGLEFFSLVCEACKPAEAADMERSIALANARHKRNEERRQESLKAAKNEQSARQLLTLMEDISEDYWCAGWLISLEYILWELVAGDTKAKSDIPDLDISELRRLHDECGGWWYFHEEYGRTFVARDEWLRMYEEHRKR